MPTRVFSAALRFTFSFLPVHSMPRRAGARIRRPLTVEIFESRRLLAFVPPTVDFDHDDTDYLQRAIHLVSGAQFGVERTAADNGIRIDPLHAGQKTHLSVNIQALDGRDNFLHVWIDFDQNEHWSLDEKVLDGVLLSNQVGWQTFAIETPESAGTGETFARLRLANIDALHPGGLALSGEVEDVQVFVHPRTDV